MMHTLQIITYEVVEKNGAQRRTKVSFVRTMMQALELVRLVKRHISGQITLSEEINPLAIVIIALRLSEGIS